MKNKDIFFAIGFFNAFYCFSVCLILKRVIYEIGIRKKDRKGFFIKEKDPVMYRFLLERNYFYNYYFISILTPKKDNEK